MLKMLFLLMKKGQVTLFVVVGIVIVAAVAMGIIFHGELSEKLQEVEFMKGESTKQLELEIEVYAQDCLFKVGKEGLVKVFGDGGYYNSRVKSVSFASFNVPYYLYGTENNVPELVDFAQSLAKYVDANIDSCLNGYSSDLKLGEVESEVIWGDEVRISVKHSLSITKGETKAIVKRFNTEIKFKATEIYDSGIEFYKEVKNLSESDFLSQGLLALENKYEFVVESLNDEEKIYTLYFNKSIEGKEDVDLNFAIKYPTIENEEDEEANLIFDEEILDIEADFDVGEGETEKEEQLVFFEDPSELEKEMDEYYALEEE